MSEWENIYEPIICAGETTARILCASMVTIQAEIHWSYRGCLEESSKTNPWAKGFDLWTEARETEAN